MIPTSWLKKKITVEAFKNLKRIDVLSLPLGYTKDSIVDVDKSVWWREPAFEGRPDYIAFVDEIRTGDEIWEYAMPLHPGAFGFNGSGLTGYALIRDGQCVSHLITGA